MSSLGLLLNITCPDLNFWFLLSPVPNIFPPSSSLVQLMASPSARVPWLKKWDSSSTPLLVHQQLLWVLLPNLVKHLTASDPLSCHLPSLSQHQLPLGLLLPSLPHCFYSRPLKTKFKSDVITPLIKAPRRLSRCNYNRFQTFCHEFQVWSDLCLHLWPRFSSLLVSQSHLTSFSPLLIAQTHCHLALFALTFLSFGNSLPTFLV